MLAKWIVCRVDGPDRAGFAQAQLHWNALARCEGFRGQFGGFTESCAHIIALWSVPGAYVRFMQREHDSIGGTSAQSSFYSELRVSLLSEVMDMPGRHTGLAEAVPSATFVRIADCTVADSRIDHFLEMQRSVWSPGMAGAPGMLGGAFFRFEDHAHRFLVVSLWRSAAEHAAYASELLSTLRGRAAPEQDLRSIHGHHFVLERAWSVSPISPELQP